MKKTLMILVVLSLCGAGVASFAKDKTAKDAKKSEKAEKKAIRAGCKARGLKGGELRDCVNAEIARQAAIHQDNQAKSAQADNTPKTPK